MKPERRIGTEVRQSERSSIGLPRLAAAPIKPYERSALVQVGASWWSSALGLRAKHHFLGSSATCHLVKLELCIHTK